MTRFDLPPAPGESFGDVLERERKARNLTQRDLADLAERLDVTQTIISRWEHDRLAWPDIDAVERVEEVLQLPRGELVQRTSWGRARRRFHRGQNYSSVFIEAPSPTLTALLRVLQRLDDEDVDRVLRFAEHLGDPL